MIVPAAFEYNNTIYNGYNLLQNRIIFEGEKKDVIIKNLNDVLFELLKLNITNNNDIIDFIKTYGLLYYPESETEIDINKYKSYILAIRAVIELKAACEQNNLDNVIYWLCVVTITGYPSYSYCAENSPIQIFLKTLPKSSLSIFTCPSCNNYHVRAFDDYIPFKINWDTLNFEYNFEYTRYVKRLNILKKNKLFECALSLCIDLINEKIKGIRLKINPNFNGNWTADSLLNALYYVLFYKVTNNTPIRKCSCSTCNNYFEIIGNYNKIYCSQECGLLEAKRKQRMRQKLKK